MLRSVLSRRVASCLPAASALFKLSPVSSTPVRSFSSGVSPNAPKTVTGEPYAQSLDFRYASVGMPLEVPYNMTMTAADRIAHQSSFYEFNRIATSRDFAGNLGFADIPMPFGLLLSHAGAMSHVDTSRDVWDLGFRNAVYVHPVFPGDTLSKSFYIQSIRSTSDGSGTVVCIRCELFTQEGRLAFSLDKLMLVTGVTNPYAASAAATAAAAASVGEPVAAVSLAGGDASKAAGSKSAPPRSSMREQIISNAQALSFPSTRPLVPSQCILHVPVTPLGTSRHLDFCNRFRLTHPLHVNLQRHSAADLVAPGLAVISLVHAASNRALFEVLHESVLRADFLNKVAPGEAVGAVTFVQSVTELPTGASGRVSGLADVTAVTLGIKNTDVVQELAATPLPVELFTQDMRPSVLEAFVEERVPQLKGKIVTRSVRSLLRQSLFSREEQIPLL